MYDKTPSTLPSSACLNRVVFLTLGLLTLGWIVYVAVTPPDPALRNFDVVLRRFVGLGLALAWLVSLAVSGFFWIVDYFRRRE